MPKYILPEQKVTLDFPTNCWGCPFIKDDSPDFLRLYACCISGNTIGQQALRPKDCALVRVNKEIKDEVQ
jgi:hypothetical protein